ncbi:SLC13 family permease [Pseudodesulfovibrio piezophilus]|uniref:SLC13A transporter family protein (TrkA domain protein) n=1 Tax=Pseudodesulfovibrio piezophilus (strain DSM 21447 / JCM 15486 / C1TLV30) TaxID=1322246 RepID=M1WKR4_PSEP2|nr:SLC13 family permease [Pseudodesulfovibrio piezophilus]CCH50056.1 SLC13A transporter family protein (TrkA domain protein) [Pseudodesulfovibrio piezophilus C1TLV30]
MPTDILIVTIILVIAVILLISEKLPVDLTGLGIIVVLTVTCELTPKEAMAGFANPAPLAVAALFVVSRGLVRTGALTFVTQLTIALTKGSKARLLFLSLVLVGTLSAFLNNTPVVVLFMSIIMAVCVRYGFAPSKFLIPLSYISILAGTCTLIGTSTNILVSDVATNMGHAPIGMFELSVLGVPIALVGGVFMFLFSDILMPSHDSMAASSETEQETYLSELEVTPESQLIGINPNEGLGPDYQKIKAYEVYRSGRIYDLSRSRVLLKEGDYVLVRGTVDEISKILDKGDATLPMCSDAECFQSPHLSGTKLVELLIPAGSSVRGVPLHNLYLAYFKDVSIIGFIRRQEHYSWKVAKSQRLRIGDVLLAQVTENSLDAIRRKDDFIILNDNVVNDVINWKRAPIALGLFLLMIPAVATGMTDILTAAFAAAFGMILSGCLSIREAYRAVDVKILMLIIGTIALGAAMRKSGADVYYAGAFLSLLSGSGPQVVLTGIIVLTSVLSHFLSNNSTAVLLVPVAIATADSLGVDPRPFIVGVAFGASACFATPIGYKTNLIVYGPGGYKFSDFLRMGIPMALIACGGAALFIPTFWPF